MFIKRGDGKIVDILDKDKLTEEQKKSVEDNVKESDKQADASQVKKSGS